MLMKDLCSYLSIWAESYINFNVYGEAIPQEAFFSKAVSRER